MRNHSFMIPAVIFLFVIRSFADYYESEKLFTVNLNDDSSSLFYCGDRGEIHSILSGPVIMEKNALLFYSRNGYILYSQNGNVIDSHTVFGINSERKKGKEKLFMGYPVSKTGLVYYSINEEKEKLYIKELNRKRLETLNEKDNKYLKNVKKEFLFNIFHNVITDEMAPRRYLKPNLVGFSSFEKGKRWWSLDRLFSFSSPVICEENGKFRSIFTGVNISPSLKASGIRGYMVEPLSVFERHGELYYAGLRTKIGREKDRYFQNLFICDRAGNILVQRELLKQENIDVVLGEDVDDNIMYTVRKAVKTVFRPVLNINGDIFYAEIDYRKKELSVYRIKHKDWKFEDSEPNLAHLIDLEKRVSFVPVDINVNVGYAPGKRLPEVTFIDETGKRRKAGAKDLEKKEHIVRISREISRQLEKKLSRPNISLPGYINDMLDSLSKLPAAGSPYSISLSGPGGMLSSFKYPPDEQVVCARVISVRKSGRILVRVDLKHSAEILVFCGDGTLDAQIVFNRQIYTERDDIIVASDSGPIIELDYEKDRTGKYGRWTSESID